ncbi:hypothetical protein CUMW_170160 [Citrus unshiu]|uniref:Uncharacterized protein n=1 Tax=Citrus unshiu TaxID=55188 RepID=A0A2H5PVX5_CITUN|nr:hypothetical protein CUMW_170150 [Citrus unshiu]GAY56216.1 hypothetical protein CUMW_170160 [Citrus unshiu]
MLRTRLLWFTAGFSLTGAAIGQFLWKDLWSDRYALSADAKQKFDALEARVSNLESNLRQFSISLAAYPSIEIYVRLRNRNRNGLESERVEG